MGGGEVAAPRIVVAAKVSAHFTLVDARCARRGKLWGGAVGNDGAADAVATDADRCDTGIHLQVAEVARGDIRECRVHVVGARGHQVHAIDLDPQAVIGQAANRWQAGNTTATVEANARYAAQQTGAVAGAGAQVLQGWRGDLGCAECGLLCFDHAGRQLHFCAGAVGDNQRGWFGRAGQWAEESEQGRAGPWIGKFLIHE